MEDNTNEQLTQEELAQLQQFMAGSAPMSEEKHNIHKFLYDVSVSEDTTKTGNINADELGLPNVPVRTLKELSLFCRNIANMDYFADIFQAESEIITSTSLSKEAKLLELAVVSKRQLEDVTKPVRKENKGWFKKKKGGLTE